MINCGLQDRKRTYELAKRAVAIANRLGQPYKGRAMSLLNRHRNALRWAQRGGRVKTYSPHFETTVCGIPCGVVVVEYIHDEYDQIFFDYILVDREGYRAEWLEKKTQPSDEQRLFDEYLTFREEVKNDY